MLGLKCCALVVGLVALVVPGARAVEYLREMKGANYEQKHVEECKTNCSELGLPLCRVDNTTWKNYCYHKQDHCAAGYTKGAKQVEFAYGGPCRDRSKDSEEEKRKWDIEWPPSKKYLDGKHMAQYWEASKYLEGMPVEDSKLPAKKDSILGDYFDATPAPATGAPAAEEKRNKQGEPTSTTTSSPPSTSKSPRARHLDRMAHGGLHHLRKRPLGKPETSTAAPASEKKPTSEGYETTTTTSRAPSSSRTPLLDRMSLRPHLKRPPMLTAGAFFHRPPPSTTSAPAEEKEEEKEKATEKPEEDETTTTTTTTTTGAPASSLAPKAHLLPLVQRVPFGGHLNKRPLFNVTMHGHLPKRLKKPSLVDLTNMIREPTRKRLEDEIRNMSPARIKASTTSSTSPAPELEETTTTTTSKPQQIIMVEGVLREPRVQQLSLDGSKPNCPVHCPFVFLDPVCGSNGKLYRDECRFDQHITCHNRSFFKKEDPRECCDDDGLEDPVLDFWCTRVKRCSKGCSKKRVPICASNGKTYENDCLFKIAACDHKDLTVVHEGRCNPLRSLATRKLVRPDCSFVDCGPGERRDVVCDVNGQVYKSLCHMEQAACRAGGFLELAPCPRNTPKPVAPQLRGPQLAGCDSKCSKVRAPVCGSDCRTYRNLCSYEKELCKNNTMFTFARKGPCEQVDECQGINNNNKDREQCQEAQCLGLAKCSESGKCICKKEPNEELSQLLAPLGLCASDGRTYRSAAEMSFESCRRRQKILPIHQGPCRKGEAEKGKLGADCDSIECLGHSRCEASETKEGEAECTCNHKCQLPEEPKWLCASDGTSYPSKCFMDEAACIRRKVLTMLKEGRCKEEDEDEDEDS